MSDAADWNRVKEILHEALARASEERGAFLRETCGADDDLKMEVESLLAAHAQAGSFAERPAFQALNEVPALADDPFVGGSVLHDGDRLGAYQIQLWLGAGGMGEVYRARDTKLGRDVAIKVLPAAFSADPDRLRRFEREARAAAALNHPNIVTIHSVEEANGIRFLTMELVEGRPLGDLIPHDGIPLDRLLNIAIRLASALSAAHSRGITHRDLKPANIMVGAEDIVKILDFGLAKLRDVVPAGLEVTGLPTELSTSEGRIVGTVAYMSPEQAEGKAIDARSDLFSLGVILYELATGQRPFKGDTNLSVMSSIVKDTPTSVTDLNPRLPLELDRIIKHCLVKDPEHRYQTAKDLRNELEELRQAIEQGEIRSVAAVLKAMRMGRRWWRQAGAVAIVVAALTAGGYLLVRSRPQENRGTASGESTATAHVRRSVAVLGFKNLSGRSEAAWLSLAFSEMLTTELAAGERLRAVSGENVARTRADLSLAVADAFAKDTLARIRHHLGADLIVVGSYVVLEGKPAAKIRLDLRLQDTVAGESIAAVTESGSESELFDLVSSAGRRLREKLGLGEPSTAEASGIRAALPSNPEAARLYSEGLAKLRLFDALGARALLEKAVALEPRHALAHSALAAAWTELGYDVNATAEARKAFDLSSNLSREGRFAVEGRYRETTREWTKAVEIYRTLFAFFPDSIDYGLRLASAEDSAGTPKQALATVQSLRGLPAPASSDARIDLAEAVSARSVGDNRRAQAAAAKAAQAAASQGARLVLARARFQEGAAFVNLGDVDKAKGALAEAQRVFALAGDRRGLASTLNSLSLLQEGRGEMAEAAKTLEQALAAYRAIGNQSGMALIEGNLGNLRYFQGDLAGARQRMEAALAIHRSIGEKLRAANILQNIGSTLGSEGDLRGARKRFEEARQAYEEIGDRSGLAVAIGNIGEVLRDQGDLAGSQRQYEEALGILREIGTKDHLAALLVSLGGVLLSEGDVAAARGRYDEALGLRTELGDKRGAALSREMLASLSIEQGRPREAEALARDAADEFRREHVVDREAWARAVLAESLMAQGKVVEAQTALGQAASLFGAIQNPSIRLSTSLIDARVRAAAGDAAVAEERLKAIISEARKLRYIGTEFEARLASAEVEMKSGNGTAARARLAALEKEASAKGFLLVARKAAALRGKD